LHRGRCSEFRWLVSISSFPDWARSPSGHCYSNGSAH